MLRILRSRQQKCSTASISACCWINWQVTCALMRALARGPSGTLMQSIPAALHSFAPSISLDASTPRGGRISTNATNLPRRQLRAQRALFSRPELFRAPSDGWPALRSPRECACCTCCRLRASDRISLMCSAVVPQHPPMILHPRRAETGAHIAPYIRASTSIDCGPRP